MHDFFFGVYPYICLTIMTLGLIFRYVATPGEFNARSSDLFAKRELATGSCIFHYAIILAFFGHFFGLLTPEWVMRTFGFSYHVHTLVADVFGMILAPCVFFGLCILLWRRVSAPDVWASTVPMDIAVILLIMFQSLTGGWQDFFGSYNVFTSVAPWARSVVCLDAKPELMIGVPLYLKIHVVFGLLIFACIPFSRLVHFFSIPLTWFARPEIVYRRRYENL